MVIHTKIVKELTIFTHAGIVLIGGRNFRLFITSVETKEQKPNQVIRQYIFLPRQSS